MFAVIKTGGKQLTVKPGQFIWIEKLDQEEKEAVYFDQVLMIDDKIGHPYLKNAKVKGTIVKNGKEKKIIVFKYKAKKNYKRKYGHRQPYTKVRIDDISLTGVFKKVIEKSEVVKAASKKTVVKTVKPVIDQPKVESTNKVKASTKSETTKNKVTNSVKKTNNKTTAKSSTTKNTSKAKPTPKK